MGTSNAAVVVPTYNEASVVGDVVADLARHFPLVLCVDDGSTDGSGSVARAAGATVVTHPVNLGAGAALQTGLDFVRARPDLSHVVTFDADGQHRVVDAVAMLGHARRSGVDVVLGSRNLGGQAGATAARRVVLRAALRYSRVNSGLELTDTHNGLRVLSRSAVETIRLRQSRMAYASELERTIAASGLTWCEYPVFVEYTDYSRSKGQRNVNAFNIVYDLAVARFGVTS